MTETLMAGGCLCSAIRYETTAKPLRCTMCHCEFCRKHSGGPCLGFVHFPADDFRWIGAEPTRYRSSKTIERGFCANCGSTVSVYEEALTDIVQVSLGSLDEPDRVKLDDHIWTQSRIAWFDVDDELPRYEKDSPADT